MPFFIWSLQEPCGERMVSLARLTAEERRLRGTHWSVSWLVSVRCWDENTHLLRERVAFPLCFVLLLYLPPAGRCLVCEYTASLLNAVLLGISVPIQRVEQRFSMLAAR